MTLLDRVDPGPPVPARRSRGGRPPAARARTNPAAALLPLMLCVAAASAAQPQTAPVAAEPRPEMRWLLAGADDVLWLGRSSSQTTQLFARRATGSFDLGRIVRQPAERLAVVDSDTVVFFRDGSIYRLPVEPTEPIPELVLPEHAQPLDVFGGPEALYALAPAPVAEAIRSGARPAPGGPGAQPLAVLRYDLREWRVVGRAPEAVTTDTPGVRVAAAQGAVLVFWLDDRVLRYAFRQGDGDWSAPAVIAPEPLAQYWVADVAGTLTLVALEAAPDASEAQTSGPLLAANRRVRAWRLLGSLRAASAWREGTVNPGQPVEVAALRAATGFNQHVALLAQEGDGRHVILFARLDAEPTLATIDVSAVVREPTAVQTAQGIVTAITFALLLLVLIGLFVFRRDSMMKSVLVPVGFVLAPVSQRLLGWLIDFMPFLIAASIMLDVRISDGLRTLLAWGFGPESGDVLTQPRLLAWWGLACGGHVVYALVLELITGRTVGKVLTRTYVLSERGGSPRGAQMFVRNIVRLLELMPQFWVFALLVLLSRNQQRLGDIFARTYVARRVAMIMTMPGQDAPKRPSGPRDGPDDERSAPDEPVDGPVDENDDSHAGDSQSGEPSSGDRDQRG